MGLAPNPYSQAKGSVSRDGTLTIGSQVSLADDRSVEVAIDTIDSDIQHIQSASVSPALQDFENHLTVANVTGASWGVPANPPRLRSTIARRWAAGFDENREGSTPFQGNRFGDLPDPNFSGAPVYSADGSDARFPNRQSFFIGRVQASGAATFGTSHNKLFGSAFYIQPPAEGEDGFTGDIALVRLGSRDLIKLKVGQTETVDGVTRGIPDGLYIPVGNQDGAPAEATFRQRLSTVGSGATIGYLEGVGATSVDWSIPDTLTFPLTLTFRLKGVNNDTGVTSSEVTVGYTVTDRDVSQAQTSQVVSVPYDTIGNTDETLLFEYNATSHVLTIGSASLANNGPDSLTRIGMEVTHDDTQQLETSTNSTDVAISSQPSTVVGREVRFLCLIQAANPNETSADKYLRVILVVQGAGENDIALNFRMSAYDIDTWQFGESGVSGIAFSLLQVYDWDDGGIPSNAPRHSDLLTLYNQLDNYLGLFVPPERNHREFTLDGEIVLTDANGATFDLVNIIKRITDGEEAQTFTPADTGLTVSLPAGRTVDDYTWVSIIWHTGVGTATDNANRDYTEVGSLVDIMSAERTNTILGGRGRGADNYGIQVATPADGDATTLTLAIINLNDASGAALPSGSLITQVRFY